MLVPYRARLAALVVLTSLALAACGQKPAEPAAEPTAPIAAPAEPAAAPVAARKPEVTKPPVKAAKAKKSKKAKKKTLSGKPRAAKAASGKAAAGDDFARELASLQNCKKLDEMKNNYDGRPLDAHALKLKRALVPWYMRNCMI